MTQNRAVPANAGVPNSDEADIRSKIQDLDVEDLDTISDLTQSRLDREFQKRRKQGRDLKVIIAARDGQTGVGKTTLGVALAKNWDENGWTWQRATFDPVEYMTMYDDYELIPAGSVILLDEVEQAADNRRAMTKANVELSQDWATKRYREITTITTLPDTGMLDSRLQRLADFIIIVLERGVAVAYKSKIRDGSGEEYRRMEDIIEWGAMDNDNDFQQVSKQKSEYLEGNTDARWIPREEHQEELEKAKEEAELTAKRAIIGSFYEELAKPNSITQQDIADALPADWEVDRSHISRLAKEYREQYQ